MARRYELHIGPGTYGLLLEAHAAASLWALNQPGQMLDNRSILRRYCVGIGPFLDEFDDLALIVQWAWPNQRWELRWPGDGGYHVRAQSGQ